MPAEVDDPMAPQLAGIVHSRRTVPGLVRALSACGRSSMGNSRKDDGFRALVKDHALWLAQ
ncbi:hypothetical protein JJ691_51100 [Kutzneria sp. CA-103260]|nr:hypothetical protein JJ691_51100 [Kutzneria sp. CA-103260]